MAKKISQLTQATEVKSDDATVIVQDGETKKLPLNMMVTKQDIENKKIAGLAKLDEIEATYENDTYTPTITVKNKSSVKTGEGDEVDYSANVMDGHAKSAILTGNTEVAVGKNKCNMEKAKLGWIDGTTGKENDGNGVIIPVEVTGTITISNCISTRERYVYEYDVNNNYLGRKSITTDTVTLTLKEGTVLIKIGFYKRTLEDIKKLNLQVELGDVATEYEEYKVSLISVKMPVLTTSNSNIFPFKEFIEGTGATEDKDYIYIDGVFNEFTIPLETDGNIYTLYVDGEIISNDNFGLWCFIYEDGTLRGDYLKPESKTFDTLNKKLVGLKVGNPFGGRYKLKKSLLCFNLKSIGQQPYKSNILTVNEDVTLRSNGNICDELNLLTGQLTQRIDEDGEVLSQEVVKTVDLMPSGTHPSTTPYCWKNGHIQLSSSGLLPNLEYSVVTSRAGQINQNATMIVKNDKRIFDLEILLAGGLVNTTYQALTLQNQVETGLSKVSLNSETEPDYLLYHMIMKLIEEKAYKLDDLTEKVSVFYLYEKLSDEQFETIYSALYPFVEDEIVEEPVVEELPEVVEDEVIM